MAAVPCVVGLLVAGPVAAAQSVDRYEFSEPHMGTAFRIVLYAADRRTAEHAAASAYSVVERLDSTFSDYHADSEVSRLSSTEAGQVRSISPELARLLTTASLWAAVLRIANDRMAAINGAWARVEAERSGGVVAKPVT